jgi:hypothetical protein
VVERQFSILESAFAQIEAAAVAGARCPFSEQVAGGSASFGRLAREGRILVEVSMHNFRKVTILAGPNKGKHTAEPPLDRLGRRPKPYLVVDKNGTRRNGRRVDTGWKNRQQPSIKDYSGGA